MNYVEVDGEITKLGPLPDEMFFPHGTQIFWIPSKCWQKGYCCLREPCTKVFQSLAEGTPLPDDVIDE